MTVAHRHDQDFLARYAAVCVKQKALEGAEPDRINQLHKTVEAAFSQVYRAVALDIDGTLTPSGSAKIDPQAARSVGHLLRRGVYVFLVTGRGVGSSLEAAAQIRSIAGLSDWQARRLSCIILNGVRRLFTPKDHPERFLAQSEDLADPVPHLSAVITKLRAELSKSGFPEGNVVEKTHSIRILIPSDRDALVFEEEISRKRGI